MKKFLDILSPEPIRFLKRSAGDFGKSLIVLLKKIKLRYFLPYFILLFVFIATVIFIKYYFIPVYHKYIKDGQKIIALKQKIRFETEKAAIFRIIHSFDSGLSKSKEAKIAGLVQTIGEKYRINPALILAVIRVESSFFNYSYSSMGAVGLMQVRPVTALYLIKKYKIRSSKLGDNNISSLNYLPPNYLYDPTLNIKVGARYLLNLLYRFKNLKLALLAYNTGPSFVANRIGSKEFLSDYYYNNVIKYFKTYKKKLFPVK